MFANDSRKYEVRERMARNDWVDFDLNELGLITLIYEMDEGESVKIFDDQDRHLNVIKREDGELCIAHKDFVMYRAYLETINKTAYFRNGHMSILFSLTGSRIVDFVRYDNMEAEVE